MARRKVLTAQIPPTPCTPEMRQDMVRIADYRGVSVAQLMREAISLFLDQNDSNSVIDDRKSISSTEGLS